MRALVLLVVLIMGWASSLPARAEDESASVYFQREIELQQRMRHLVQKPTHLIRRAKPVRGFTLDEPLNEPVDPWGEGNVQGQNQNAAHSHGLGPIQPAIDDASNGDQGPHIAIVGDSLAQDLARGLGDSFAERHDVTLLRFINAGARLGRDDAGDAGTLLHDVLVSKSRIDVVVVMLGLNDLLNEREGLPAAANAGRPDGAAIAHEGEWARTLSERAATFVRQLQARKIAVIWVGMPIVKADRLAGDADALNGAVHDQLTGQNAVYVDVWDGFQDDRGLYAPYGPDINGQFQKMRLADGVHFTRAGARTLAYFVEGDLRSVVDAKRGVEPVVPLPLPSSPPESDASTQPRAPVAGVPSALRDNFGLNVPLPAPPADVVIPVHVMAGPVIPLSSSYRATGGQLVGPRAQRQGQDGALSAQAQEVQRRLDQVFRDGQASEPRRGRTDDFSWPLR
jgi:uncharacterized protein